MFDFLHKLSHTYPWLFLGGLIAVSIIAAQVIARIILAWNGTTMEQWRAYKEWRKWH